MRCGRATISLAAAAALVGTAMVAVGADSPAARRSQLIRQAEKGERAVPVLRNALDDPNMVVRRTAARLLAGRGSSGEEALLEAFDNQDAVVRQTALKGLLLADEETRMKALGRALKDESVLVRLIAVNHLATIRPQTDEINELLGLAGADVDDAVRSVASKALWPFHRHVTPLRERKDWDHEVDVAMSIPLPKEGWAFKLDPNRDGHLKKWYEPQFDAEGWETIEIEQAWQQAGYDYTGVTWYRRWVEVPPEPAGEVNAVDLAFGGVDESAWVWVNGVYVGSHDIGPAGWNKPFTLDITDALKWGEKNQITVRAMNTAHAGGIWRPVKIEILR